VKRFRVVHFYDRSPARASLTGGTNRRYRVRLFTNFLDSFPGRSFVTTPEPNRSKSPNRVSSVFSCLRSAYELGHIFRTVLNRVRSSGIRTTISLVPKRVRIPIKRLKRKIGPAPFFERDDDVTTNSDNDALDLRPVRTLSGWVFRPK